MLEIFRGFFDLFRDKASAERAQAAVRAERQRVAHTTYAAQTTHWRRKLEDVVRAANQEGRVPPALNYTHRVMARIPELRAKLQGAFDAALAEDATNAAIDVVQYAAELAMAPHAANPPEERDAGVGRARALWADADDDYRQVLSRMQLAIVQSRREAGENVGDGEEEAIRSQVTPGRLAWRKLRAQAKALALQPPQEPPAVPDAGDKSD